MSPRTDRKKIEATRDVIGVLAVEFGGYPRVEFVDLG
jgi:hypothetical protein